MNPDLKAGPGRPKGAANKATIQAREAIARFVDGNVDRLQGWLDAIATGKNEDGEKVAAPNPALAFNMFKEVLEYHIPKLQRTEHHAEITIEHIDKMISVMEDRVSMIENSGKCDELEVLDIEHEAIEAE